MLNQIKLKSKKAITKLFDFNYYVSVKWRYFLIKKNLDKQIFVVYSDGKVGSTTMSASLYKNFPDSFVFHVHRLSEKSVDYLGFAEKIENSRRKIN
jgi:hypothetical protein